MLNLIRNEWQLLLFGFLMTFWSSPGQTFLISLFSGELRAELGFSDGEFAAIYSAATLLSAIVMVWSGALADRIDLKKLSMFTVVGLAIGCGMMSLVAGAISLFVSLFLLRQLGQGLMYLISSTAMVRYIDAHKGKANAIASMGYTVAEAVMPGLLVLLLLWVGWRHSWQIAGVVVLIFMVPAILLLLRNHHTRHTDYLQQFDDNNQSPRIYHQRQWTRNEVIRDPYFYLFCPGLMSQPLMFTGFIFHQVHLVESKGWSLLAWAAMFSLYAVVSVATKLVTGVLIDRYGAIRMVPLIALPMGIGLLVLAFSDSLLGGAIFLVLTGVTVGYQSTTTAPFWSEMYGSQHLGAIKSLGTSAMVFCTALSPLLIGWQIDLGTSMETLAVISAIYIFLTSGMARYACVRRQSLPVT